MGEQSSQILPVGSPSIWYCGIVARAANSFPIGSELLLGADLTYCGAAGAGGANVKGIRKLATTAPDPLYSPSGNFQCCHKLGSNSPFTSINAIPTGPCKSFQSVVLIVHFNLKLKNIIIRINEAEQIEIKIDQTLIHPPCIVAFI